MIAEEALTWCKEHGMTARRVDGAVLLSDPPQGVKFPRGLMDALKEYDGDLQSLTASNVARASDSRSASETHATPWPEPLAPEAYYGLAGDIVKAISPHTEADDVALLAQNLAAFGSVIERGPHFTAEADRHFTNVYIALVGDSSKGRKGTSWGHIRRTYEYADSLWVLDRIQDGLSSGEGVIHAVRDRVTVIETNKRTQQMEESIVDEGVHDKRLLIQAPEFAGVLQAQGREGNTLSAVLRTAWDSGNLRVLTRKSPLKATDAHISIVAHVTREELRRLFRETDAANGYGNRFLWFAVKRSKMLPEGGRIGEADFAPLVIRLRHAIDFARDVGEMCRDPDARAIWHDVYPTLSDGRPGLLGAITARAEAQVMRLACLYALMDQSDVIRASHLLAALALWKYSEQSARWIFGDALGDPVADDILASLRMTPEGLTRTDISTLFGRHRNTAEIGRALGVLADRGLARAMQIATEGRTAERWFARRPGASFA